VKILGKKINSNLNSIIYPKYDKDNNTITCKVVDLNKQIWGLVGSSLGNVRGLNSRMPR
jgi:hypothetical protein